MRFLFALLAITFLTGCPKEEPAFIVVANPYVCYVPAYDYGQFPPITENETEYR
jgi:hypothetical protein